MQFVAILEHGDGKPIPDLLFLSKIRNAVQRQVHLDLDLEVFLQVLRRDVAFELLQLRDLSL